MKRGQELKKSDSILSYWNPNVYSPKLAKEDVMELLEVDQDKIKEELVGLLDHSLKTMQILNERSSYGFANEEQSKNFVKAIYAYLFENGLEPDIDDYL